MDRKMQIAVIALALGVVAVAFLASPIQAYMNSSAALLQTRDQDRDRLRTHQQDCDGCQLQTQARDHLRTQDGNCSCAGAQNQNQYRQEEQEGATNGVGDCSMEQVRYQHRERIGA